VGGNADFQSRMHLAVMPSGPIRTDVVDGHLEASNRPSSRVRGRWDRWNEGTDHAWWRGQVEVDNCSGGIGPEGPGSGRGGAACPS
jgi:hypothetical protein